MRIFIRNKEATDFKNIFIDNNYIYLSDKDIGESQFLEKFNSLKKRFFDIRLKINCSKINKFTLNENENIIILCFPKIDDEFDATLEFKNKSDFNTVKNYLITQTCFSGTKESIGNKIWLKNTFHTLIAGVITGFLYIKASQQNIGEIKIKGRRKLLKMIIAYLVEFLGAIGILILGIIITLGLAYWTFTQFKKRNNNIEVYS